MALFESELALARVHLSPDEGRMERATAVSDLPTYWHGKPAPGRRFRDANCSKFFRFKVVHHQFGPDFHCEACNVAGEPIMHLNKTKEAAN